MSHDRPDIAEILTTVREFALGVADKTQSSERYDALCAAFLLAVVKREIACVEVQDEQQRKQLVEICGHSSAELDALYRDFCEKVRAGRLDTQWHDTFDFALRQVVDKVLVTRPDYLLPEHRSSELSEQGA